MTETILATLLYLHNHILTHPIVTILQFHGLVPCILLGTLWTFSAIVRRKELFRIVAGQYQGHHTVTTTHTMKKERPIESMNGENNAFFINITENISKFPSPIKFPHVSIILPTRGLRQHSIHNWKKILQLHYGMICYD